MHFDIDYHDGEPSYVHTDDGFMQTGRPFDPATDGWMLEQLDPGKFEVIHIGRQVERLVAEVNRLRRENWSQQQELAQWRKLR